MIFRSNFDLGHTAFKKCETIEQGVSYRSQDPELVRGDVPQIGCIKLHGKKIKRVGVNYSSGLFISIDQRHATVQCGRPQSQPGFPLYDSGLVTRLSLIRLPQMTSLPPSHQLALYMARRTSLPILMSHSTQSPQLLLHRQADVRLAQ